MVSTASGRMSVAITRALSLAASTAANPSPPPISSTRSPGRTARWRQKKSEPALGAWTCSGTRKRQPRQEKTRVPASLLAKDAPEVEAERFLELGPGSGRGLGVLEHVDVDLQRDALALDAVELGGEPATLVRLGEDELRALERAVVLRELLHRLDDDALDLLGFGRGNRRERRRQLHLCHVTIVAPRSLPSAPRQPPAGARRARPRARAVRSGRRPAWRSSGSRSSPPGARRAGRSGRAPPAPCRRPACPRAPRRSRRAGAAPRSPPASRSRCRRAWRSPGGS